VGFVLDHAPVESVTIEHDDTDERVIRRQINTSHLLPVQSMIGHLTLNFFEPLVLWSIMSSSKMMAVMAILTAADRHKNCQMEFNEWRKCVRGFSASSSTLKPLNRW